MVRNGSVTAGIVEYQRSLADHRAGTLDADVLQVIEDLAPQPLNWSMETGCGKTTILLSNLSAHHYTFAYDDREHDNSSVAYYSNCPVYRPERTTAVFGPTQTTLPAFRFEQPIDLALLDGPHAYPFPELEYYYVYPKLRTGALLVLDDIHIPTINQLHTFLVEDEMFRLVQVERTTAFFIRTAAPAFSPLGDGWEFQRFNQARFPVNLQGPVDREPPSSERTNLNDRIAELERRLVDSRRELGWWKHVADERRLKRRLARRLGNWAFLR
jgi:methyltransferase family protein